MLLYEKKLFFRETRRNRKYRSNAIHTDTKIYLKPFTCYFI